jgi:hypothetical protein
VIHANAFTFNVLLCRYAAGAVCSAQALENTTELTSGMTTTGMASSLKATAMMIPLLDDLCNDTQVGGLSLPGFRLLTWTLMAVINCMCFDWKITL